MIGNSLAQRFAVDVAVQAATKLARETFQAWVDDPSLEFGPTDEIGSAQMRSFGHWVSSQEDNNLRKMASGRSWGEVSEAALHVIGELGECFDASYESEKATAAFARVLVWCSRLATSAKLAFSPIMDLGRVLASRPDITPHICMPALAQALLDKNAPIEVYVAALGLCIAKGVDDVEVLHELKVKVAELFVHFVNHEGETLDREITTGEGT